MECAKGMVKEKSVKQKLAERPKCTIPHCNKPVPLDAEKDGLGNPVPLCGDCLKIVKVFLWAMNNIKAPQPQSRQQTNVVEQAKSKIISIDGKPLL